jgi:uncharacterized protein (TIGR03067 family)
MNRALRTTTLVALACPALLAVALASSAAPRPDDPPKGPADLQGCWKLVSVETDGTAGDPFGGGHPRWIIKGDAISYGGEEIIRITTDPSTSPRVLDLKFRDPDRVYEGVYVVEKDTLKVCLNRRADAKDRPSGFSTKDQADWRLLVFEREKRAPADPTEGATAFAGVQLKADEETKAIIVAAPIKGSAAEKAGLKKDDEILKVAGAAVTDLQGTVKMVRQAKPGEKLEFRIRRAGKEQDVTVKVGVLPFQYVISLE